MSDQTERLTAVRPDRSVIVQAPAGSGKTTLLVERYLRLLEIVDAPEEILAITFTRKAAAEMRERILHYLQWDAARGEPAAHERAVVETARRLAGKVEGWSLAENPQRLMIRTIDSFSHYLARSMPVASGLGPVPTPVDDARPLYRRCARLVLDLIDARDDPLSVDLEVLLAWRGHRTQDLEDLLTELLGGREQWLRALTVTPTERDALEGVLDDLIRERLAAAREALAQGLASVGYEPGAFAELLTQAASNLEADDRASAIRDWPGLTGLPAAEAAARPAWVAIGEALLKRQKEAAFRSSVDIRQGFPSKSPEKEAFSAVLESLSDDEDLAKLLHQARSLPAARYGDDEWPVLAALIRVLIRSAQELAILFAEMGQTDFTGIAVAAGTALGGEAAGFTDLGLYLDRHIRHILVDEYQDTNWTQFHLLEKLTHGWERDDGRTLFVVGDPMQSIYRFREAEVGLFMQTRDDGIGDITLDALRLTRNFRSRAELVAWVNDHVGPAFPAREEIAAGAVRFAESEPARGAGGSVLLHALPDAAEEAERISDILSQAISENAKTKDWHAAIIVRSRSHLRAIVPALKRRGVAFRAVKLDPLAVRPAVQDLLSLTRAIRLPADRTALLAVLRAPWCGLTLAELHTLAGDGADPASSEALARLNPGARTRAERVFDALIRARDRVGRRSLRDLVEGAWTRLGGPWCLADPASDGADVSQYLSLLQSAESEGLLDDLNDFAERVAAGYTAGTPPTDDVRVEILTMHGAKGLEWELVILPQLNAAPRRGESRLLHWLPAGADDERVLLAPLRRVTEEKNGDLVELIRAEQMQREAYESQRLLYVAATRAREQLVLTTVLEAEEDKPPKPGKGTLLELLWPSCGATFSEALDRDGAVAGSTTDEAPDNSLRRVADEWRPPIPERFEWRPAMPPRERDGSIEFDWAGAQARRTGTVVHTLLERVGQLGVEALTPAERGGLVDRIPKLLRALGTGPRELTDATAIVRGAFEGTLDSKLGRWILSGEHEDAACERPLTGILDGELVNAIIDRTFIDADGTRWIIDYKSGFHAGGNIEHFFQEEEKRYADQLSRYRRLLEQLGEKQIRTALHFPRHGVLRVVGDDQGSA